MIRLAAAVICGISMVVVPHAVGARFVPLGDLPGGNFLSHASDVSADGAVVVGWSVAREYQSPSMIGIDAFRWTRDGGMVGLGQLAGYADSAASGVSANGAAIVGSSHTYVLSEAFRWTAGEGMAGLGIPPGHVGSYAYAVSADGLVIAGGNHNAFMGGHRPAFRWTSDGGMTDLGDLPGGDVSASALDLSADGSVVVGWSSAGTHRAHTQAFRWTSETGMTSLGTLLGGEYDSAATAASTDGSVIAGWSYIHFLSNDQEAFRWTNDKGLVGLGDLPGGPHNSFAEDISADGTIVVGRGQSEIGQEAFMWDAVHGMRRVSDVLMALDVDLTGWTLRSATAIAADGKTIVGIGINPRGQTEAWLAEFSVPEPTMAGPWLFGAVVFARLRAASRPGADLASRR